MRARLPEHDLTDVDRNVLIGVDGFGDARRAGRKLHVAFGAVAMELDVRQMDRQSFGAIDRGERRLDAARHAEIAAVNMDRMDDAQLLQSARQRKDDVARRYAVVGVLLVEIELALIELERADAARIDDLDGNRLGRVHRPGDIILDRREIGFAGELAQEEIVRAEHDKGAFVDDRRIAHFQVRLPRIRRQHRRLERRRVSHLGVAISGIKRRRDRTPGGGTRQIGAPPFHAPIWSSGISMRAIVTLPPPMCECGSMPPAITTRPCTGYS